MKKNLKCKSGTGRQEIVEENFAFISFAVKTLSQNMRVKEKERLTDRHSGPATDNKRKQQQEEEQEEKEIINSCCIQMKDLLYI